MGYCRVVPKTSWPSALAISVAFVFYALMAASFVGGLLTFASAVICISNAIR